MKAGEIISQFWKYQQFDCRGALLLGCAYVGMFYLRDLIRDVLKEIETTTSKRRRLHTEYDKQFDTIGGCVCIHTYSSLDIVSELSAPFLFPITPIPFPEFPFHCQLLVMALAFLY